MLPKIEKKNLNQNTIDDISEIDFIVSKRNRELSKDGMFLMWSFPRGHVHELQTVSDNYFIVWCGTKNLKNIKSFVFGRIHLIEKYLNEQTNEDIKNYLEEKI